MHKVQTVQKTPKRKTNGTTTEVSHWNDQKYKITGVGVGGGGLNWFYRRLTLPSSSAVVHNI